jgi:hypothetical protein
MLLLLFQSLDLLLLIVSFSLIGQKDNKNDNNSEAPALLDTRIQVTVSSVNPFKIAKISSFCNKKYQKHPKASFASILFLGWNDTKHSNGKTITTQLLTRFFDSNLSSLQFSFAKRRFHHKPSLGMFPAFSASDRRTIEGK